MIIYEVIVRTKSRKGMMGSTLQTFRLADEGIGAGTKDDAIQLAARRWHELTNVENLSITVYGAREKRLIWKDGKELTEAEAEGERKRLSKSEVFQIRISSETKDKLSALAAEQDRTMASVINRLIEKEYEETHK